jgi:hypothetical protein
VYLSVHPSIHPSIHQSLSHGSVYVVCVCACSYRDITPVYCGVPACLYTALCTAGLTAEWSGNVRPGPKELLLFIATVDCPSNNLRVFAMNYFC